MLVYFLHGVDTRNADYSKPLQDLISQQLKKCNLSSPHFYSGFWGHILSGSSKIWHGIDEHFQKLSLQDNSFNPDIHFRYKNFRKEYFSNFIGDAFTYLENERINCSTVRRFYQP